MVRFLRRRRRSENGVEFNQRHVRPRRANGGGVCPRRSSSTAWTRGTDERFGQARRMSVPWRPNNDYTPPQRYRFFLLDFLPDFFPDFFPDLLPDLVPD